MAYCQNCGDEIPEGSGFCSSCGNRVNNQTTVTSSDSDDTFKIVRLLLTFFLGFIGSFIINHTDLKPNGWSSRTCAYFFLSFLTFGIYPFVAAIFNLTFNANKNSNIGYFKDFK